MKKDLKAFFQSENIINSSIIYALAVALGQVVSFLTLPFILRDLSIADYGYYGMAASIISLLATFSTLSVGNAVLRFGAQSSRDDEGIRSIVSNSFFIVIVFAGIVSIVTIVASLLFSSNIYGVLVASASFFTAINTITQNYLRVQNRILRVLCQSIIYLTTYLSGILILHYFNRISIFSIFIIQILAYIGSTFFGLKTSITYISAKKVKKEIIKTMLLFSLPLLAASLIELLLQHMDIWMLKYLSNQDSVGLFNFIKKFNHIVDFVKSAFFMAWPYFAYKYIDENKHKRMFSLLMAMMLMIIGSIMVVINPAILFLGGEKYVQAVDSVGITITISLLSAACSFMDTSASVSTKTKLITMCCMIGIGTDFILNYMFIPLMSYKGAALATVMSYFIMLLSRVLIYRKNNLFMGWSYSILICIILFVVLTIVKALFLQNLSYFIIGVMMILVGIVIIKQNLFKKNVKEG